MTFQNGWVNNIRGMKLIWGICKNAGFQYLRTRAFNQDPLENLFGNIRQHGASNTNPSPFQFTAALKTSVLNSLISSRSSKGNCQDDNGSILDNFQDFFNVLNPSSLPTELKCPNPIFSAQSLPAFDSSSIENDPLEA